MKSHESESPLPRLLDEIAGLNTKLHELSIRHYRQVVDARQSLTRCASVGAELEIKVEHATGESLPNLRGSLTSFQDLGRKLVAEHKKTLSTIDLHSQLVELLQIPQLMDTCARSGAIEEALELCSFARTLRTRHDAIAESVSMSGNKGKGAEIVRWVADEVEQSATAMRRQLLQQLRGQIDLPTCLRLLSHLKRLDAQRRTFGGNKTKDELSLRKEFLEARDAFLQMQTAATTERGDLKYQTTLKVIQKNREIWFDVITQYQAIFGVNADDNSSDILSRWIGSKVEEFLKRLKESLSKFENCGEIRTVYELSSSFAASLARVGADFRPLLPPLFTKRTMELMNSQWQPAVIAAKEAFSSGEWGEAIPSSNTSVNKEDLSPSLSFLQYPALVELVNSLLRSFNDLRSFACVNMMKDLAKGLKKALETALEGLEAYSKRSEDRFQVLLDLFGNRFLSYIAKCFAAIFEWKTVNQLLDVSSLVDRVRVMLSPTFVKPKEVEINLPSTSQQPEIVKLEINVNPPEVEKEILSSEEVKQTTAEIEVTNNEEASNVDNIDKNHEKNGVIEEAEVTTSNGETSNVIDADEKKGVEEVEETIE